MPLIGPGWTTPRYALFYWNSRNASYAAYLPELQCLPYQPPGPFTKPVTAPQTLTLRLKGRDGGLAWVGRPVILPFEAYLISLCWTGWVGSSELPSWIEWETTPSGAEIGTAWISSILPHETWWLDRRACLLGTFTIGGGMGWTTTWKAYLINASGQQAQEGTTVGWDRQNFPFLDLGTTARPRRFDGWNNLTCIQSDIWINKKYSSRPRKSFLYQNTHFIRTGGALLRYEGEVFGIDGPAWLLYLAWGQGMDFVE